MIADVSLNLGDSSGLPGVTELQHLVNTFALMMEILCLAGLVAGAGLSAWGRHTGNMQYVSVGNRMIVGSLAGAFLIGGSAVLINFFTGAGASI